ncbi:MAG: twin-arginine translocation signal domain-containing protein, partial [Pedobacter sp.]
MQSSDKESNQGDSRRDFLKKSSLITAIALTPSLAVKAAENQADERFAELFEKIPLHLTVNNKVYKTNIEPRVT